MELVFRGLGLDEIPQGDSVYRGLSTGAGTLQHRGVRKERKE